MPIPFLPNRRRSAGLCLAGLLLAGCNLLEFSPNDFRVPDEFTDLTRRNLAALQAHPLPPGDTLRFILTGDSQRYYDDADALVASINRRTDVQFLLVTGDVSDFGLAREMRWIDEKLRRLHVPYLTVVGNHDLGGNGRFAYEHVFGARDYSFVYGDTKFILLDTNGREYNFDGSAPALPWLRAQTANLDGARRQIVVSHVPPDNADFDPALRDGYVATLREAPHLVCAMNGHNHSFRFGQLFNDGVVYVNSDSFQQRYYLLVTVWGDQQLRVQRTPF